jgi:hypothetical protein
MIEWRTVRALAVLPAPMAVRSKRRGRTNPGRFNPLKDFEIMQLFK